MTKAKWCANCPGVVDWGGWQLIPSDEMIQAFFNKCARLLTELAEWCWADDLDLSGTLNNNAELQQLTLNLNVPQPGPGPRPSALQMNLDLGSRSAFIKEAVLARPG